MFYWFYRSSLSTATEVGKWEKAEPGLTSFIEYENLIYDVKEFKAILICPTNREAVIDEFLNHDMILIHEIE